MTLMMGVRILPLLFLIAGVVLELVCVYEVLSAVAVGLMNPWLPVLSLVLYLTILRFLVFCVELWSRLLRHIGVTENESMEDPAQLKRVHSLLADIQATFIQAVSFRAGGPTYVWIHEHGRADLVIELGWFRKLDLETARFVLEHEYAHVLDPHCAILGYLRVFLLASGWPFFTVVIALLESVLSPGRGDSVVAHVLLFMHVTLSCLLLYLIRVSCSWAQEIRADLTAVARTNAPAVAASLFRKLDAERRSLREWHWLITEHLSHPPLKMRLALCRRWKE